MTNVTVEKSGAANFTQMPSDGRSQGATVFTDRQGEDYIDSGWDCIIDQLRKFYRLDDDWDGNDSVAPQRDLVRAAERLAYRLKQDSHPAPDRVVAGVNGTVSFEYAGSPFTEIEVVSADEARVYENGRRINVIAF